MPAETDRLEVYEAADGWRWKRVGANNENGCSGEAYTRKHDAERASLRWNPDLDSDWVQVPPVVDSTQLDLINRLLNPADSDDQGAIRAQLEALRP